jgi:hypothetical protein
MTATSIGRIVVPYLALVAACGAALVFGITHLLQPEPPVETKAATAAPAISPPASGARDEGPAALATAQVKANAVAVAPAVSPRSPDTVGVDELPHRAVIDLQATLGEFGRIINPYKKSLSPVLLARQISVSRPG